MDIVVYYLSLQDCTIQLMLLLQQESQYDISTCQNGELRCVNITYFFSVTKDYCALLLHVLYVSY